MEICSAVREWEAPCLILPSQLGNQYPRGPVPTFIGFLGGKLADRAPPERRHLAAGAKQQYDGRPPSRRFSSENLHARNSRSIRPQAVFRVPR